MISTLPANRNQRCELPRMAGAKDFGSTAYLEMNPSWPTNSAFLPDKQLLPSNENRRLAAKSAFCEVVAMILKKIKQLEKIQPRKRYGEKYQRAPGPLP